MRLSLTSIALLAILATLLFLLPRTVTSCPVRTPLDVSCPLENNYLSNPNQSDDILYQDHYMFANYLRRTTKSLRPSSTLRSVSSSSPKMTSPTTNPSTEPQKQENPEDKKSPQLALPSTSDSSSTDQKLDVHGHGTTVSLDHLGPIVVNQDGTMSRISNWEKMTEIEKRNTMRIIGKRNKQRLDALKAAGVEGGNS